MIFHEIAVEPESIQSLRDLQCVIGLAGFSKGRLIANYPQKGIKAGCDSGTWVSRVCESVKLNEIGKVGKVQELLIKERKKLPKSNRDFKHGSSWIENARREHSRLNFSALIVEGESDGSKECCLDDLHTDRAPACLADDQHVQGISKHPGELAKSLLPMLRYAGVLRFVDPHYLWWDNLTAQIRLSKWHAKVPEAIFRQLANIGRMPRTVEFHLLEVANDAEKCVQAFSSQMAPYVPRDWRAKVFVWRELEKRFHARYILTDIGGVGSEYGLDEGRRAGDETDIYLLTQTHLEQRNVDFSTDGDVFKLAAGTKEFYGTGR